MAEASRHDAWQSGDRYDAFMGRWSRMLAPRFLDWFGAAGGLDWLDVGCGTGALSSAVLARANPHSLTGIDPSESFLAAARANVADPRAAFHQGNALATGLPDASRDAIVSGLVMNFVPDRPAALAEMRRVARPGGAIGFYVWDYPGAGLGFLRAYWRVAALLDPGARDLAEDTRFPFCTPDALTALARDAGLSGVDCTAIEVPTVFADFEDYWHPFTLGTGPAPGYCASLAPDAREGLRAQLSDSLPRGADGSIAFTARAWAIRARSS